MVVGRKRSQLVGGDDGAINLDTAEPRLDMVTQLLCLLGLARLQRRVRGRIVHGGACGRLDTIRANKDIAGRGGSVLEQQLNRISRVTFRVTDQSLARQRFGARGKLGQERAVEVRAAEPHVAHQTGAHEDVLSHRCIRLAIPDAVH